jgi:enoyl-CoA hydratase
MELAGATDIRIAGNSARFALPEVRRGVMASGGSLARLPRQIAYAPAMQILPTGMEVSAHAWPNWDLSTKWFPTDMPASARLPLPRPSAAMRRRQ